MSEAVRIIEYEILSPADSARLPFLAKQPAKKINELYEVGVLRCVDRAGQKLTYVGDGRYTRRLVITGVAGDPAGVDLPENKFPIIRLGWPDRLDMDRKPAQAQRSASDA